MNGQAGSRRKGFSLLEVLIAITLMAMAFTMIWSAFTGILNAWQRGTALLDRLHHGDFVMEQLVSALRSTAYFTKDGRYGFWLEDKGGSSPRDEISWVTSGTAFLPPDSPLSRGLHRLRVAIGSGEDGVDGFAVEAWSQMMQLDDLEEKPEQWIISSRVKGLDCRVYNLEEEQWEDTWEKTNDIPSLVEITLYLEPTEEGEPEVKVSRLVEIPMAPAVTNAISTGSGGSLSPPGTNQPAEAPAAATQNPAQNVATPGGRAP